ncbi:thiopurine S-methyltransferase [Lysobacter solisilvae (ex Woo and Kim 2020)]|uniref:Thiopurine S-methyltransferase n=1 Tax=Agrilutibacter terrestris TaxID=2865112 RepID=A0A7H0FW56_9GAMM|nr:thiopurine S-methyltransferase [Lysobacter terrestris]QNP40272.1 thiopurine S-methyltransferase [Lysobacter terrestris]
MQPDFWHQRWHDNQIGFHQDKPTPLLLKHWPGIGMPAGAKVFVPLAGKSLDMVWFASQGYRVLAVELSPLAIKQFISEHGIVPEVRESQYGTHYIAGNVEIIQGDVFALDAAALEDCSVVFDRAALIALPPELRRRYVDEVYSLLPPGCRSLLITLEYPQGEKQGPPFSVGEAEVRDLYAVDWHVEVLERRDILAQQPAFIADGVTALDTVVYRLIRR